MQAARRLENGNLFVPAAVEGPGGVLADGMFEIGPDHPDYGRWLPHIEETGPQAELSDGPNPEAG